jgi:hypothetical protein
MDEDMAVALHGMRDRFAVQRQQTATLDAGMARSLAISRAALEQGRELVEWFSNAERVRWLPSRHR